MLFIAHRINTVKELKKIPINYGIEVDLRDNLNGDIYLAHDPFVKGELFDEYLKYYKHALIILNIKSERIEYKILELLKKYNINNYFFLDSSFPMIYQLSMKGERNIAIRYSEYESIESVLKMKDKVEWVWVDCFTKLPLDYNIYSLLLKNNFKLCLVSPELQKHNINYIQKFKKQLQDNNIIMDAICTKIYNIEKWL